MQWCTNRIRTIFTDKTALNECDEIIYLYEYCMALSLPCCNLIIQWCANICTNIVMKCFIASGFWTCSEWLIVQHPWLCGTLHHTLCSLSHWFPLPASVKGVIELLAHRAPLLHFGGKVSGHVALLWEFNAFSSKVLALFYAGNWSAAAFNISQNILCRGHYSYCIQHIHEEIKVQTTVESRFLKVRRTKIYFDE